MQDLLIYWKFLTSALKMGEFSASVMSDSLQPHGL